MPCGIFSGDVQALSLEGLVGSSACAGLKRESPVSHRNLTLCLNVARASGRRCFIQFGLRSLRNHARCARAYPNMACVIYSGRRTVVQGQVEKSLSQARGEFARKIPSP